VVGRQELPHGVFGAELGEGESGYAPEGQKAHNYKEGEALRVFQNKLKTFRHLHIKHEGPAPDLVQHSK
jgi:hypothetical protein